MALVFASHSKVDPMAQFLVLESTNVEGKPNALCINIEQICRVFMVGTLEAPESLEVHMSDGQRLVLQEEAASALLALVTHARNTVDLHHPPSA